MTTRLLESGNVLRGMESASLHRLESYLLLSALKDTFDASLSATRWPASSVQVVWDTGRAKIPCTSSYYVLGSDDIYDFTNSSIYALITPATGGTGTRETLMGVGPNSSNLVEIFVSGTTFGCRKTTAGTPTTVASTTYNSTTHAWWRIRESAGTIYFDYSSDGLSWSNLGSTTVVWNYSLVYAQVVSGYYGTESAADTFVDNVNTPLSLGPAAYLQSSQFAADDADGVVSYSLDGGSSAVANRCLFIIQATFNQSAAVGTYGGVSLVPIDRSIDGNQMGVWYLQNPAAGVNTLAMTGQPGNNLIAAIITSGTKQSGLPYSNFVSAFAGSGAHTLALTTTADGLGIWADGSGSGIGAGNQDIRETINNNNNSGQGNLVVMTQEGTGGVITGTWPANGDQWRIAAFNVLSV